MVIALEVDANEDLRPLSAWLRQQGVPHRIFEASGKLRVEVPDVRFQAIVETGWQAFKQGELPAPVRTPEAFSSGTGVSGLLRRHPVVLALVAITLLCFPATASLPDEVSPMLRAMLIVPTEQVGDFIQFTTLQTALAAGELWRLWTPALLHFGILHLAFNLLWMWEFGRRIEVVQGHWRLLEVVLVLAPIANLAQWYVGDGPMFGGLSGVVYGLLGYLMVAARRASHPELNLPPGLVIVLLGFLVLFSTGITTLFGLHIANAAHWGGLIGGMLWAFIRVPRNPRQTGPEWAA